MEKKYNGFYLVANYPTKEQFIESAVKGLDYFDFLEIGIPFSDPVADGPVIAQAAHEMVEQGITLEEILVSVREIREKVGNEKDFYFMTYANHIYIRGTEEFAQLCKDETIKGVIIPDIPYEESSSYKKVFKSRGVDFVHFISLENTHEQIKEISKEATGFLYCVSLRGTTGSDFSSDPELVEKVGIAKENASVPVILGFGIKTGEHAKQARKIGDGIIVGTKTVELSAKKDLKEFITLVKELTE
jgi:tryptophan synthase alpha chain